jgi:hypothetical protein
MSFAGCSHELVVNEFYSAFQTLLQVVGSVSVPCVEQNVERG